MNFFEHKDYINYDDLVGWIDEMDEERSALEEAVTTCEEASGTAKEELEDAENAFTHAGELLDDPEDGYVTEEDMTAFEEDVEKARSAFEDAEDDLATARAALEEWNTENGAEYSEIASVLRDMSNGDVLVSEDAFEAHARELAESCESVDFNSWPFWHIDWESAATSLMSDYTCVTIDDIGYLMRG